ncbi:thiosulfate sulfurtransferas-like protein [Dothidotthia symphoricarpi CBS 119687]|uniref:Thiosulfate sulfurtransferas-like protein n=1 Tax=Dothidotthia symphoricarpi CBS 119687 TaxID=1392245 RepID=A0A6A6ALF1_9PLEO|nr:thiosulfate sulfurtransferas-like protein [Dothidotthia symphoricarpi CBS 119687]KAF2131938.1 thiosulfate sulfurtransferas-like protein [Dothidotthia symphoricarpi CBS 119687]
MLTASFRNSLRLSPSLPSARLVPAGRRAMSQYTLDSYLVTPAELNSALQKNIQSKLSTAPRIVPVCASWFLPNDGRVGKETFIAQRIPHARFFDLDAVKDPHSPYPHMLPSAKDFAGAMRRMGIRREDSVVVYDSKELGIFSAPRVGWTLKVFGHPSVHVLNNFRKWVEEGYPTETGEPGDVQPVDYAVPELDQNKVVAFEEVREIAKQLGKEGAEEVQILDARSLGRWKGVDPEPREGLSSGHIPYSISVPISDLLDPNDKTLLPASQLQTIFKSKGVDSSKPIISSCGTGVTAAVVDAALTEAGFATEQRRLYDGSWTEWAQRVTPGEGLIRKDDQ